MRRQKSYLALTSRVLRGLLAPATVLWFGAANVTAQVDNRVRPTNQAMDGRVLDANMQVGSGGYNQPSFNPYRFDYGVRANEYITGNVSGLGRFQGDSPIIANNAFRLDLPSAGLAPFRAQSVSLPEVTSGMLRFGPGSYYDPQQISTDAGSIRSGLNAPGSSMLVNPYRPPQSPFERDALSQFKAPDPTDTRLHMPNTLTPGIRQVPMTPAAPGRAEDSAVNTASRYLNAGTSSIFGAPTTANASTNDLAGRATPSLGLDAYGRPQTPWQTGDDRGGISLAGADSRVASDSPIDARSPFITPKAEFEWPAQKPEGYDPAEALAGTVHAPGATELTPGITSTALIGGDRYLDLAAAVQAAQSAGLTRIGFVGREKDSVRREAEIGASRETGGADSVATAETPKEDGAPADPSLAVSELAIAAKWAAQTLDDPVRTFVGRYGGRVNEYMLSAEVALHAGRYYDAARYYELASTIDPDNPLPHLGRGHALAVAGDYLTSVLAIESGIMRFPQIAAFRLDLPALVGRRDAFDVRRADLERRLESSEDYQLRFLLGYLELYSGLEERGLRNLERAAAAAPEGSPIWVFPDLLTGRRVIPPLRTP